MKTLEQRLIVLALLVASACTGVEDGGVHEHEGAGGHDHGTEEAVAVTVTQWTDLMELFMEYPVPVAGRPERFIIHLTVLDGFQPVREGTLELRFVAEDGSTHDIVETELLREGIFTPTVLLPDPGAYGFVLVYDGQVVRDSFSIDGLRVYPSADRIPKPEDDPNGDEITFLKEQQWKIPFATDEAEIRETGRSTRAIGEVLPSPNSYVEIVSPVDGVVRIGENGRLALPGSPVKRGDVLVTITPPIHGNGWASSHLAYEQAERDYRRAERLKARRAISDREFERIRNEYLAMKAGFENFSGSGGTEALALKAPISGTIIEWQVRSGQRVSTGEKLMAIVDPTTVWLQLNVPANEFREFARPSGVYIRSGLEDSGWEISGSEMKVLTTGAALNPATRTVPVLLEVSNGDNRLKINESLPVELYAGEGVPAVAVPRSAVYEDDGMDVVFIQKSGESFEKRIVTTGDHYRGRVPILHGLVPGERLVTTGGYHVKLASIDPEVGHGHAH